jgi:poly-gamma-glutamate capsule biosynthesis protein CapA/YwtB (metallophosphatase superfamily)
MLRAANMRLFRAALAALALFSCTDRNAPSAAGDAALPPPVAAESSSPGDSVDAGAAAPVPKPEPKAERLVVLFGGDVSLARGAGQRLIRDPKYDPFHAIAPLLATADLRMANLESQLSDQSGQTQSPNNHLVFTGPPAGADALARAGFGLVSFANNHVWDYGKSAFLETLANLDRAGVRYAGASREPDRMYEPSVLTIKGWSVAVFAVTEIWNQGPIQEHEGRKYVAWAAYKLLEQQLAEARRKYDLVLVSYHGGGEYMDVPMQWTRSFVAQVMKGGANAFFGHHPHVPHGVGWYDGKPAFFSLGNFVFAMHSDYPWTGTSFMARVTFHQDGHTEVEACPYTIIGHTPTPFEGKAQPARERAFISHLKVTSLATGGTRIGPPAELGCVPLSPPSPPH